MEISEVYKKVLGREELILNGVSGSLNSNGITILIGPSGSGKSTLLKLLNRLEEPDVGSIRFQGKELTDWDVRLLRQKVAMIFQHPTALPGTVLDNIHFVLSLRNQGYDLAHEILSKVGISKKLWNQPAVNLSGGEKQRLAFARALIGKPEFLLIDEGTSALDPASVHYFEEMLLQLNREMGLGILWISHDPDQVMRMSQQVWVLSEGAIKMRGNPNQILREEMVRHFFGKGVPQ